MGCRSNEPFFHHLAKRLHTHHGAQRCSADHRTWSSRRSCCRSKGTSNGLSPGCNTHSHDGACCSWLLHQPVHDLENSITPEPALGSVEAATHYALAVVGRESANHTRCCHSLSCLGRIPLPSLHLPIGRIEKIRVIKYRTGCLSIGDRPFSINCSSVKGEVKGDRCGRVFSLSAHMAPKLRCAGGGARSPDVRNSRTSPTMTSA